MSAASSANWCLYSTRRSRSPSSASTASGRYSLSEAFQSRSNQVLQVFFDTVTPWVASIQYDNSSAVIPSAQSLRMQPPQDSSRWRADSMRLVARIPPCDSSHLRAMESDTATEGWRSRRNFVRRYGVAWSWTTILMSFDYKQQKSVYVCLIRSLLQVTPQLFAVPNL